jgi:hypothetical protein
MPCTAQDAGSGTCVPLDWFSGLCVQGGTVPLGGTCAPLEFLLRADGIGSYPPLPNPSTEADLLCETGSTCASTPDGGVCVPIGDAGCFAGLNGALGIPTELNYCKSDIVCACPSICSSTDQQCESPCQADADCPLAYESCAIDAGHCGTEWCVTNGYGTPIPGTGTFNGDCAPMDAGGTCIASGPGVSPPVGFCFAAGSATSHSPCFFWAGRPTPTLLCASGLYCVGPTVTGDSVCEELCDPSADSGCTGAGEQCQDYTGGVSRHLGYCCLPSDAGCTANQACCSGCGSSGFCL